MGSSGWEVGGKVEGEMGKWNQMELWPAMDLYREKKKFELESDNGETFCAWRCPNLY